MSAMVGDPPVLGVDLGGTKVLVGVFDASNHILGRGKRPTPAREGSEAILAAISEAIDEALGEAGLSRDEVAAAGVGSPGPLDADRGVILFSANLNVRNFPLGPELSRRLGCPVLVRNDVRVGGYGEFRLGAGQGYHDLLVAFVGTGIGGCVILRGHIVHGSTGNAGEIGHVVVKADGPRCGCGRRGCMEALASRTAISRRIFKAIKRGESTRLENKLKSKSDRLRSRDLAEAFGLGDPVAVREVQRAARFLGLGLAGLINVFGPQVVIVGGGVTEALGPPYLELVRVAARGQILFDPDETIRILPATLGDDAGIIGGALKAREALAQA